MSNKEPIFNVRTAAEMLGKPLEKRISTLRRQKHPKNDDSHFAMPYYQPALTGMRRYFQQGKAALMEARSKCQGLKLETRRANNERVVSNFEADDLAKRQLGCAPNKRVFTDIDGVTLKLSPDLVAIENGKEQVIFINCTSHQYDPETARRVLEIGCYVLTRNGYKVDPNQFQFVDLFGKATYRIKEVRKATIDLMLKDLKDIKDIWPEL